MINAVSEQFNRFVTFAEDQRTKGAKTAIATKGDVAVGGGTPLEERGIKVTEKTDWVGLVLFRSKDTKTVNNEVRELFRKTVAEMFGGESNIPDSVKEANADEGLRVRQAAHRAPHHRGQGRDREARARQRLRQDQRSEWRACE